MFLVQHCGCVDAQHWWLTVCCCRSQPGPGTGSQPLPYSQVQQPTPDSQLLAEGVEQGKGSDFQPKKVIERGLGTANRPWSFIGFNQPTPWRHGAKAGGSSFKPERCFHTACHYTVGLCHGSLAVPATASKYGRKKS